MKPHILNVIFAPNGLTIRNTQVVWATPKNRIYGAALDQDQMQNLVLDQDSFDSAAVAK